MKARRGKETEQRCGRQKVYIEEMLGQAPAQEVILRWPESISGCEGQSHVAGALIGLLHEGERFFCHPWTLRFALSRSLDEVKTKKSPIHQLTP